MARGATALVAGAYLCAAAVDLGLNVAMVPLWGLMGAVASTALTWAAATVMVGRRAKALYGLHFNVGFHVKIVAIGLVLSACAVAARGAVPVVALAVCVAAAYVTALRLSGPSLRETSGGW